MRAPSRLADAPPPANYPPPDYRKLGGDGQPPASGGGGSAYPPPDYRKLATQSLSRKSYTLGNWRSGGRGGGGGEGSWRPQGGRTLDYASDTDAVQSPPR